MQAQILIIIATATLYTAFGFAYTEMLRTHWFAYHIATEKHPLKMALIAIFFWWLMFITFITWRIIENLTTSRKNDWHEL